jgi:signal transduction histidine kinase
MALALRNGTEHNGQEIVIERPDGSRWVALAHANPFHDESGRVCGAVNVLMDITERKRDEEALREADRRKSEFLALLAHELRNPLAPLRNGLQIMRLANHDATAMDQARTMMERQLGHMVRLIDDLLDLSRITNGKIELRQERIDLTAAVCDAVEACRPLIEASGHELAVTLPPVPVYVDADRTRLAQVFANLLNNSAKYTERGGHIRLAVERHGSDAVVTVTDDGVGIPADKLPKVFDMFMQVERSLERSQGGLGIGLSLVRGLVEMHGGRVEAHSDGPGRGSEFVVRLTSALSPVRGPQEDGGGDGTRRSSKCRILIVDDNEDAALSLGMMLKIMGHDTRTAHDGLAAVEAAGLYRPDVVLLDIGLPRLNGYDACRRIREQPWGEGMVLIALTGWGQDEDKRLSKEAGFNFHLVKPLDPAALEKLLAGLLLTPA